MAYDEKLADRIRQALGPRPDVTEKKMFGGLVFLRAAKMFVGIVKDDLMGRVGPWHYEAALAEAHVRRMDCAGRAMVGCVFVGPGGSRTQKAVKTWVELGAGFVATLDKGAKTGKPKRGASRGWRHARKSGRWPKR